MPDLRKRNPRGGFWNPTPPLEGVTPFCDPPAADSSQHAMAMRWVNFREAAVRDETLDPELRFTVADGEWPTELFNAHGIDPDPGPLLAKWIQYTADMHETTRIMGACLLIGMDTAWLLAHEVTVWATNDPDVTLAKDFRHVDNDVDDDVITWAFSLGEYMTRRIGDAMFVDFAEKYYWEQQLLEGDAVWGWRPEMIVEAASGLNCAVTTPYGLAGAPAMNNYPQGHEFFWMLMMLRAARVLNGRGVDLLLRKMAVHGGFYRMGAGVHDPESVWSAVALAEEMADDRSYVWDAIDAAKLATGWPKMPEDV